VMFAWQNASQGTFVLPGLEVRPVQSAPRVMAKFDLTLSLREVGNRIVGGLEYATALFEPSTIERYIGYFRTLLEAVVADDTQVIDRLPMLPQAEREKLLFDFNDTRAHFTPEHSIHELVEAQAARTPNQVAVVFENQRLTYCELNQRANQLAHWLRKNDVGPETLVGICMERSPELVIGILGILKAGGAYVPFDTMYPPERLN
jgi:non-ribosomal peptide synthetase component F